MSVLGHAINEYLSRSCEIEPPAQKVLWQNGWLMYWDDSIKIQVKDNT